jgi:sphingosine kinase
MIVTVSGDGLPHEVVNGIMERPDKDEFLLHTALALIPGGTSNGVHKNITYFSGEAYGLVSSVFLICKGETRNMDVT